MPNYELFNSPIMQATWQNPVNAEFLRGVVQANGAPQLQEAVAEEQAQANFNRDMANNALMAEMANRGAYAPAPQSPAMIQGFMPGLGQSEAPVQQEQQPQQQQRTPLNQLAKMFADQIVTAKAYYGEAERAGNQEAMMHAHNAAEQARARLQQLGVDPASYGLNGTYEQAQDAMASNDVQAMQNVLMGDYKESSGANYRRNYQYLLEQGFGRSVAERIAGEQAELYSDQRQQALMEAFEMYGHDKTTNNPFGIQLLKKIAEEDIDAANFYATKYAGPLQEYAKQNARENAAIQHQYGKEDRADAFGYDMKKMDKAQENRIELKQIDAQIDDARAKRDFILAVQLEGVKAQAKAAAGGKTANGYTKEQAQLAHDGIKEINRQLENSLDMPEAEKNRLINQRAQLQAIINSYEGIGQQSGGGVLSGVDVNDYNSLREAYQKIVEGNARAFEANDPNNPSMDWDELNRAFLKEVGEDNPMALNIVENSPYKTGVSSNSAAPANTASSSAPRLTAADPNVLAQAQAISANAANAQELNKAEADKIRQRQAEAARVKQWNPNG